MSSTISNSKFERPRWSPRVPHWGWYLLVTVVLIVAALALSIWWPYHREHSAAQEIRNRGGMMYDTQHVAPEWLRSLVGEQRIRNAEIFDRETLVTLQGLAMLRERFRVVEMETLPVENGGQDRGK